MTIFVHLGAHKTGSTLLQNMLFRNRESLVRQKVFYQRGPGRHPFFEYYRDQNMAAFQNRCVELRERFQENAARYRHVVFSSETLFGTSDLSGGTRLYPNAPWVLDILTGILKGMNVHFILYTRRQDDFIESTFINRLQTLATSSHLDHRALLSRSDWSNFDNYLQSFDFQALSWHQLASEIADRFGRKTLTVRPYESIALGKRHYCEAFFGGVCDPSRLELTAEVYENRSFSATAMHEFITQAPSLEYEDLKPLRLRLQAAYPVPHHPRPRLLSLRQRIGILEALEGSNRALFSDFICDSDQEFHYSGG
ncbi:MAG: hypothetical protein ACU0BN_00230 [Sulfitobacter sp.]